MALGDDSKSPRYIRTITRRGYCFIAPVTAPSDEKPDLHVTAGSSGQRPVIARPPKLAAPPPTRLFGRQGEQTIIARCWEEAIRGKRQLVLIAGEPGIGKTRLAVEAARNAYEDGAIVLFGSCDADVSPPYRPFIEALGHFVKQADADRLALCIGEQRGELIHLVPELSLRLPNLPKPQQGDTEAARYRIFEAVADLLREISKLNPVMLVLDDLQWARMPDLFLLKHLTSASTPQPLAILCTYRDTDLPSTHPLVALLAHFRRETGVERIALKGLDEDSVAALASAMVRHDLDLAERALARGIHQQTSGNPSFVGEILRGLREHATNVDTDSHWTSSANLAALRIPDGIREVLQQRLSRLSPETQKVLGFASAIGREFELALLTRETERSANAVLDALDEAIGAGLVSELPGRTGSFAFTHALIHAILYDDLTAARRARIHHQTGLALRATGSQSDERIDDAGASLVGGARPCRSA